MTEVVVTTVLLLGAVGALLALQHWLANSDRYREEMTEEEYEESLERGSGLLGSAMMAVDQQIFRRSAERAIEYRIDAEQGQLPGGGGGQGEALGETDVEPDDDSQTKPHTSP